MTNPRRSSEVKPQKVRWLWRERIPRGFITVVAGRPDQGKGLFGSRLAADVSNNGGRVLMSTAEDDDRMMTRPRLEAAGANLNNVFFWRFVLPRQTSELVQIIQKEELALIVMDPFAAHLSGVSRFSDQIRDVLNPLTEAIEETGTSIVIIEHALKRVKASGHPLDAIGGSGSGLPAAARMAYLFGVDPNDDERRVIAPVKSNLREAPKALAFELDVEELPIVGETPSLVFQEEYDAFDASRLVVIDANDNKVGRRPDKRAAAAEWLTNYLVTAGKPVKSGQVMEDAKQYGMTVKTLRRAAEDMQVVKNPPGGGRNCTWDLSDSIKRVMGIDEKPAEKPADEKKAKAKTKSQEEIDAEFKKIVEGGDES
jgi:putative DNA primase/helicase